MSNSNTKLSYLGLMPLMIFLIIYFLCGIIYKDFSVMPLLVAMIISFLLFLVITPNEKRNETITSFCKGAGHPTIMMMVTIYILSGAFSASISAIQGSDFIAINSIKFLPSFLLLPGMFLIGVILSFSMGSSMGAVTTLMPVALSVVTHSDISIPLACGVVVSGVIAGDNLSFISDTSVAAAVVTGTTIKEKFKESVCVFLVPAVITLIILFFIPIKCAISESSSIPIFNLLPIIMVIILSVKGISVIPVLAIGTLLSFIVGYAEGMFTIAEFLTAIHGGIIRLEEMALIAVAAGGLIGIAQDNNGIEWICQKISQHSQNKKFSAISIALTTILLDIVTANNTMAIITCGPIAKKICEEQDVSRTKVATILGYFSTITNGIVPYAGHLMAVSGLSKIAPISVIPYVFYDLIGFITGFLWLIIQPEKTFDFVKKRRKESD